MSSRTAQRIGRPLCVSWMQSNSGCDFLFPTDCGIGMLMVSTIMGVLKPSCNGLYLMTHEQRPDGLTHADS
jgi:hypothetical protein